MSIIFHLACQYSESSVCACNSMEADNLNAQNVHKLLFWRHRLLTLTLLIVYNKYILGHLFTWLFLFIYLYYLFIPLVYKILKPQDILWSHKRNNGNKYGMLDISVWKLTDKQSNIKIVQIVKLFTPDTCWTSLDRPFMDRGIWWH